MFLGVKNRLQIEAPTGEGKVVASSRHCHASDARIEEDKMNEKLSGKKVVIIVAHEFEDIELLYPLLRLSEEGAEIVVVPIPEGLHPRPQLDAKPVTGRFGHTVPIPVMGEGNRYTLSSIEELDADDVDCLLFPGGYSPDAL